MVIQSIEKLNFMDFIGALLLSIVKQHRLIKICFNYERGTAFFVFLLIFSRLVSKQTLRKAKQFNKKKRENSIPRS